ncbi:MAG: thioredoxin domain-containing protein [Acidobacteriota bacterium]
MSVRTRILAVVGLILIACVAVPLSLTADQAVSADAQANFAKAWAQQPRVDLGIPASGAKVVIVKFNDFMCPSCRQAEAFYKPVLDKFAKSNPGAVKYVVKDWPWNSGCNFNTSSTIPGHEAACNAAAAARMARDRGKYDEMVEWLYANQGTTAAAVRAAAERLLAVKDFDAEYARKLPEIRRDVADGGVLRINSTPTFFINGVRLPEGTIAAPYFELAISLELKRAG